MMFSKLKIDWFKETMLILDTLFRLLNITRDYNITDPTASREAVFGENARQKMWQFEKSGCQFHVSPDETFHRTTVPLSSPLAIRF